MKNTQKQNKTKIQHCQEVPWFTGGLQTRQRGYELGGQPASWARVRRLGCPAPDQPGTCGQPHLTEQHQWREGVSIWSQRRAIEVEPGSCGGLGAQGPQHRDSAEEELAAAQATCRSYCW